MNQDIHWEERLDALHSHSPYDGGDQFDKDVMGWPFRSSYYVYEWRSFPYTSCHRYIVPQTCSDYQVKVLVENWLKEVGYYK